MHRYISSVLKEHGIKVDKISTEVMELLQKVIRKAIYNMLSNVQAVLDVSNVSIAKAKHFELLLTISRQQCGGRVSLPSEYFSGVASGHYASSHAEHETIMSSFDPAVTSRPGLDVNMVGGSSADVRISTTQLNAIIADYMKTKEGSKRPFRIASDARPVLQMTLKSTLDRLINDVLRVSKSSDGFTLNHLKDTLKQKRHAHLLA